MKHLVFISSNYPSESRRSVGTFVQQLVYAVARQGTKCSVITPVSYFHRKYGRFDPVVSYDYAVQSNPIKVLRPRFVSFSSRQILGLNSAILTQKAYEKAVVNALGMLDEKPSMLYGHFLYESGAAAVGLASKLDIPSCIAVGESSFWSVEPLGFERAIRDFKNVSCVVSVSSLIKRNIAKHLLIDEEKIKVFPNGVDHAFMYPRNRSAMREKYSLPQDRFIVSFIGHFDERKGPHRLLSAVTGMDNIGLIFIGKGSVDLEDDNILFKGTVSHEAIPELLSASDIFVLPTLEEGSCNSIIEAMACGLPVVTSKGEFNDDIVDDNVSIRVDPRDVNAIKNAVARLSEKDGLKEQMSAEAIKKARSLDIGVRADNIMNWLENAVNNYDAEAHKA